MYTFSTKMHTSQQYIPYGPGNETDGTIPSVTQASMASQKTVSATADNHQYHQPGASVGISLPQQSPVFSALMTSQGQSLFNAVYTSPSNYANQNNFPSSSYNGYCEPPVWFTDTQVSISSNNTMTEGDRISRNQCSEKKTSFCNSRIGAMDSLCSPLPAEAYKSTGFQSKMDNQNWACSQGMMNYVSNSQNQHNIQQTSFKCSEQFSSCSLLPSNVLPDLSEFKHLSNINFENSCFLSSPHNRSPSKHVVQCSNEPKNKEIMSKYPCSLQKDQTEVDRSSSNQPKHQQEQGNYDNISATYSSNTNIPEHALYSQIPHIININNESTQTTGKHLLSPRHVNYSGQIPILQQHFHDPGLQCDMMDSCLQNVHKPQNTGKDTRNLNERHTTTNNCCNLVTSVDQPSFSPHLYTMRPLHCFADCLNATVPNNLQLPSGNTTTQYDCNDQRTRNRLMCSASVASTDTDQEKLLFRDEDVKENSNDGSSVAGESDIIVAETEDESESEISMKDGNKNSMKCCVCNILSHSLISNKFTPISDVLPLTSSSRVPVVGKLAQVLGKSDILLASNNSFLCRVCMKLIDSLDYLEGKLALVKQDILLRFNGKNEVLPIIVDSEVPNPEKISPSLTKLPDLSKQESTLLISQIELKNYNDVNNTLSLDTTPTPLKKELRQYTCNICSKHFASKEYLRKHVQNHTKEYSFCCDRCGEGFAMRRGLEKHLLLHTGAKVLQYQCEVCGKQFMQRHSLDAHLRKHNGNFRFTCTICSKGYTSHNSLRTHLRTHTGERLFVCQHCGRKFATNSNLSAHVKLCSGDLTYNCETCNKGFSSKLQLRSHVLSLHGGTYPHKCDICGKGFIKNSDCQAHFKTHSSSKSHKCKECGKCYTSLGNLNQHAAKHKNECPIKCPQCDKGFFRRSALDAHVNQLHTGVSPYGCDLCPKRFVARRNLQAHQKWHSGTVKTFTCTICGKSVKHSLQTHMRTHSGFKPYACSLCDMRFTVKSTLDKHAKTKHAQDSLNV